MSPKDRRQSAFADSDHEDEGKDTGSGGLQQAAAAAELGQSTGSFFPSPPDEVFPIGSSRTLRDLGAVMGSGQFESPAEQAIPDVYPLQHRYDDAVEETEMLKQRVTELEKKIGSISGQQEAAESDLLSIVSACRMILGGVLTEKDFLAKPDVVEQVRAATHAQSHALQISTAVRDREVKVAVFGPSSSGKTSLVSALGGKVTKNISDVGEVGLTNIAYQSVKFTFWDCGQDFMTVPEASRRRILSLADALVVVVRGSASPEELASWRDGLRSWLTADASKAPLAVVVTGSTEPGAISEERMAEALGVAHLWERRWASFGVSSPASATVAKLAEDGLPALLWVYDAIQDDTASTRQAEFSLESATRQARLLSDLKDQLVPDIAAKYDVVKTTADSATLQLHDIAVNAGDVSRDLAVASPDKTVEAGGDLALQELRYPDPTLPICEQRPKFGNACELLETGGFYEGGFRYWRRDGTGLLVDQLRGELYEGQFRSERAHGSGVKKWSDGSQYGGQWKDGLKHGTGKLNSADGRKFDGQWVEGHRHGKGVQVFENKDRYFGQWREGQQHGKGKYHFYASDGEWVFENLTYGASFEGEWVRGCYHGAGTLHRPNQPVERLEYQHGVLLSRESVDGEQSRTDMHAHVNYPTLEPTAFRVSETTRLGYPGAR